MLPSRYDAGMREVLIVLVVLAGAMLLLGVVGLLLPRRHKVKRSARLPVSPQQVWDVITDYVNQPRWNPNLDEVRRGEDGPDGQPRWIEVHREGFEQTLRVLEAHPPHEVVWDFEEPHHSSRGTWTALLEPVEDNQTKMTIVQRDVIRNPFARVIAWIRRPDSEIKLYLEALRTYLQEREQEAADAQSS